MKLFQDKLRDMIEKAGKACGRSMIIIDEMDKMPKGLIDTLKPYLDYYEELGGVDYRNMMFFFLRFVRHLSVESSCTRAS